MASLENRSDNTYHLVASCGYDSAGKKLRKRKTVTPPDGLTERQKEKELNRLAVLFDREVENGTFLDGEKITLTEFIEIWLRDYAEKQLAPKTLERYKVLIRRINTALGYKKLSKLQPTHIIQFYNNLCEVGIRDDKRYTLSPAYHSILKQNKKELNSQGAANIKTIEGLLRGKPTTAAVVTKLSECLDMPADKLFAPVDDKKALSNQTILHHHRLL